MGAKKKKPRQQQGQQKGEEGHGPPTQTPQQQPQQTRPQQPAATDDSRNPQGATGGFGVEESHDPRQPQNDQQQYRTQEQERQGGRGRQYNRVDQQGNFPTHQQQQQKKWPVKGQEQDRPLSHFEGGDRYGGHQERPNQQPVGEFQTFMREEQASLVAAAKNSQQASPYELAAPPQKLPFEGPPVQSQQPKVAWNKQASVPAQQLATKQPSLKDKKQPQQQQVSKQQQLQSQPVEPVSYVTNRLEQATISEQPRTVETSSVPPLVTGSVELKLEEKSKNENVYAKFDITFGKSFLPDRPKPGEKGRKIELIFNCLNVKLDSNLKILMYDLELKETELLDGKLKKGSIINDIKKKKDILRKVVVDLLKGKNDTAVFDGGRIIFSDKPLPLGNNGVERISHVWQHEQERVKCAFDIQRVNEDGINVGSLVEYVQSKKGRSDQLPQESLRALDTIIKEMFINKNLLSLGGRAIFSPKSVQPLRCGPYQMLDGYTYTFRPHQWNIRFNFDKTQIVLHEAMDLLKYCEALCPRGLNVQFIDRKLRMLRVEASHYKNPEGKQFSRKFTIHGFSRGTAKEERIDEKKMSVEEYFLKEYGIRLKRPDLRLVKVHKDKPIYIPIELLKVPPHERAPNDDPAIVQEVIRHAAAPAFERLANLRQAVHDLGLGNRGDKYLNAYRIQIDTDLINSIGRVLDGPDARFGGKQETLRNGKWDMRQRRFVNPYGNVVNWAMFGVGNPNDFQRNENILYQIEEMVPKMAGIVGIKMNPDYRFEYVSPDDVEQTFQGIIEQSKKDNKKLDLLVCVVNDDSGYKAVKIFGDVTYGIATQCINFQKVSKARGLDQYIANIMLKVNGKLGGTNWELPSILDRRFSPIKDPFMIFGMDVTHPNAAKNDLSKSVAAVVGSIDNGATLYSAVIQEQIWKRDKKVVEELLEMENIVTKLLTNFYQKNNGLRPCHLIFYRDGVSEGQFKAVFRHEISAIQNACEKLEKGYQPKITYIVVQKRHKIRFFPKNQGDAIGRSGNVPAGTVVDTDITHCREFDFYLCSHEGIQGTSKPAHYHVLYDDNNWGSDDLQSFTYYLCHLYARSTRSVSYPAPTYYAHLAAFRGRTLIAKDGFGHNQRVVSKSKDGEIKINDFHKDKLFFI